MAIKALIFDFDGLILETEGPIYQSWHELYQAYGFDLPLKRWATIIGTANFYFDPYGELESLLGRKVDWAEVERARREREAELIDEQPVLPGVEDYLRAAQCRNLKIGLASSSSCQWVVGHLTRLGLYEYFDCIRGKDDVAQTKPAPELYLAVMEEFQAQGNEVVVFEDSPHGVMAAKRAGTYCVAVPTPLTSGLRLEEADLRLSSLAEMPLEELLAKIGGG